MSAHTPGPWVATQRGGVIGGDGLIVAHAEAPYARGFQKHNVPGAVPTPAEEAVVYETRDANARLIAAAPDLLTVAQSAQTVAAMLLRGVLDAAGVRAHAEQLLKISAAAIAKAGAP